MDFVYDWGGVILGFSILAWGKSTILMMIIRYPIFLLGYELGNCMLKIKDEDEIKLKKSKLEKTFDFVVCLALISGLILLSRNCSSEILWERGLWWYPIILGIIPVSVMLSNLSRVPIFSNIMEYVGDYSLEVYLCFILQ